jgi:hypothetical protein
MHETLACIDLARRLCEQARAEQSALVSAELTRKLEGAVADLQAELRQKAFELSHTHVRHVVIRGHQKIL